MIEKSVFDHNVSAMAAVLPGDRLRPHTKAFKSTALAKQLVAAGHNNFCAATVREIEGMAQAGLDNDLLLANETYDYSRLAPLVVAGADITAAVDSDTVLDAVIAGGVRRVLIDVEVGLPRCGCSVEDAGRLADRARAAGLEVRGVMGYEGHLMMVEPATDKAAQVKASMALLLQAHDAVGGDIVSGGGTGTYAANRWVTEIQAGSYCLLDTEYAKLDSPFEIALTVLGTVVAVNPKGWAVADAGLKAFGLDHGLPTAVDASLMFLSDEHATLRNKEGRIAIGDRIRFLPAHVDPTVARHTQFWVVDGETVVDEWPIDLRHW